MVKAFGVPRFVGQEMKKAPAVLKEINENITRLDITSENVISIVFEQDMVHVFYA